MHVGRELRIASFHTHSCAWPGRYFKRPLHFDDGLLWPILLKKPQSKVPTDVLQDFPTYRIECLEEIFAARAIAADSSRNVAFVSHRFRRQCCFEILQTQAQPSRRRLLQRIDVQRQCADCIGKVNFFPIVKRQTATIEMFENHVENLPSESGDVVLRIKAMKQ